MKKSSSQKNTLPAIFEAKEVRRIWDEKKEKWYFSVIDIVSILIGQTDFKKAQSYWTTLKSRLKKEGNQSVTKCDRLKMLASDGKKYLTDVADLETVFRLIQSVPSPKAEPIKLWLAKVGQERINEMVNPELALNRSREYWKKHGRTEKWIQQRMMSQETRNKLTDYWQSAGVAEGKEYAILTNIIHQEWTGLGVQDHKSLKNINRSVNLRDHMSEAELIFTALAELSTRQIAENMEARGLEENKIPAKRGGKIARDARLALEDKTGRKVVTNENYLPTQKSRKKLK